MTKDCEGGTYEYCNIPESECDYYPTEAEQATVMEDANSRNPFMLKMKRIWNSEEESTKLSPASVAKFLQRLFVEDRIPGLLNKRSRLEQRDLLYCYISEKKDGHLYMTKEEIQVLVIQAEAAELLKLDMD